MWKIRYKYVDPAADSKQTGKIASGEILFEGRDLAKLSEKEMRQIRGNEIAMIFQDSMTGLNPVMTIGKQLVETITAHSKMDKKEAWARAEEMLTKVGIPLRSRLRSAASTSTRISFPAVCVSVS